MSEYNKTKLNIRKWWEKVKKNMGRVQIMSKYNKTKQNLRKRQKKVKKEGEGSNYVGIC